MTSAPIDPDAGNARPVRFAVFLGVLLLTAGGGLLYDYSRPAIYRATARISVEPPGATDAAAKAEFAMSEAQALRRSEILAGVLERGPAEADASGAAALQRSLTAEALPQTGIIELRSEGPDRNQLEAVLQRWIDAYVASRKETDRQGETESADDARHAAQVAQQAVDGKRRELEAFRQRNGIVSTQRDDNPSAARLKGLNTALNDAATREVNAEARLNAVNESIAQGKGVMRGADKTAIANLEMRAVDLREKLKDMEHDYTAQYLALDPKHRALKANLARAEQQIQQEKERSEKAALVEAQEEFAGAQRAARKIRGQAEALEQESQAFSSRFAELQRMAVDLEQLQESRRVTAERLAAITSARKPAAARIRVVASPAATFEPVSPDYSRDAALALGGGLLAAIGAVWLVDYLRREPRGQAQQPASQPIIQIAYPMLQQHPGVPGASLLPPAPAGLLGQSPAGPVAAELTSAEVSALWNGASPDGRLILAALFAGIAPAELAQLRWKHIDLTSGCIDVPGASSRRVPVPDFMRTALAHKEPAEPPDSVAEQTPLLADGIGEALDVDAIDRQLACAAHDAGLRHPQDITGRALHFTYAAFLARQGIRMSDLAAMVGQFTGVAGVELMRLAPPGHARPIDQVDLIYPAFRPV